MAIETKTKEVIYTPTSDVGSGTAVVIFVLALLLGALIFFAMVGMPPKETIPQVIQSDTIRETTERAVPVPQAVPTPVPTVVPVPTPAPSTPPADGTNP